MSPMLCSAADCCCAAAPAAAELGPMNGTTKSAQLPQAAPAAAYTLSSPQLSMAATDPHAPQARCCGSPPALGLPSGMCTTTPRLRACCSMSARSCCRNASRSGRASSSLSASISVTLSNTSHGCLVHLGFYGSQRNWKSLQQSVVHLLIVEAGSDHEEFHGTAGLQTRNTGLVI